MALPQDTDDLADPTLPKRRQAGAFPDPSQFGAEFTGQPSGGFLGQQPSPVASFDSGRAQPADLAPQQPASGIWNHEQPSGTIPYIGGAGDPNARITQPGVPFIGGPGQQGGNWGTAQPSDAQDPSGHPRTMDPTTDALMKGLTAPSQDDYAQRTRDLGGRSLVGTAADPGPAPPSAQPATSQPSTSGGTGRDWFMDWTKGKSPSKETLLANEAELKAHGYTLVPNATMGPDGKPTNYDVRDPNGRIVDAIVGGSNPGGGSAWQYDDSGGAGGSGGAYGKSSFSGGGYGDAIHDALMRLLGRGEGVVNANDPLIAGATGAYRQQADRSLRHSRNMLAERAAAEGLNSGGEGSGSFDSALQSQQEQEGRDIGSFQSGLMLDENKQRRGDVMNALQAMLSQYGLGQQNQQFYDTMGYNMGRDEMQQNYLYNGLLNG